MRENTIFQFLDIYNDNLWINWPILIFLGTSNEIEGIGGLVFEKIKWKKSLQESTRVYFSFGSEKQIKLKEKGGCIETVFCFKTLSW